MPQTPVAPMDAQPAVRAQPPAAVNPKSEAEGEEERRRPLLALSVAALGVVYGDIGTSPLYAFKQSFHGVNGVASSTENILGLLSLIVWSLIVVVSVKYLVFVLKADNKGEGGIIALVALLNPWHSARGSRRHILMLMGLFGAALLYGDGTITPAISVLSAVEGLKLATPAFDDYVVPIAIAILFGLFAVQKHGTSKIGALFGPVMLGWFVTLGLLGFSGIAREPHVFAAFFPGHAVVFLHDHGLTGFIVLGTVFLAVTGAETLYADMGHFGRQPIRLAWFAVALPALLLNYFGQGALVLSNPGAMAHPFYGLGPTWAHYPLVILATVATVIASQAVISGTFSLTRQAVQLGQLPRLTIVQTDREHIGQIYIPFVNWTLMLATIGLVIGFETSSNLAAAYGLAVSADMVITSVLAFFVALRYGWHPAFAGALALAFLVVDIAFLGSNLFKFLDGGWYPVLVAALVFTVMGVWRRGVERLRLQTAENREPLDEFLARMAQSPAQRVPGTAVFMTADTAKTPTLLTHALEHLQVLHERVILVTVSIDDVPRVGSAERAEWEEMPLGFHRVVLHYGFMQSPNIPVALRFCEHLGLTVDPDQATFFLGHEEVISARQSPAFRRLQTQLFAFLWRNAARATAFYKIPSERVVAIALQVEM
jgi:KUP system potassium uptake protein